MLLPWKSSSCCSRTVNFSITASDSPYVCPCITICALTCSVCMYFNGRTELRDVEACTRQDRIIINGIANAGNDIVVFQSYSSLTFTLLTFPSRHPSNSSSIVFVVVRLVHILDFKSWLISFFRQRIARFRKTIVGNIITKQNTHNLCYRVTVDCSSISSIPSILYEQGLPSLLLNALHQ